MSQSTPELEAKRQSLQAPLDRLQSAGVERPPHLPVSKFLELVADGGLASHKTCHAYLAAHNATTYGGGAGDGAEIGRLAAALDREIAARLEAEPEIGRELAGQLGEMVVARTDSSGDLGKETVDPFETGSAPPGRRAAAEPVESSDPKPDQQESVVAPQQRSGLRTHVTVIAIWTVVMAVWSVLMIGVGYFGEDAIAHLINEVNYQFLGGVRPPRPIDEQLAELRSRVGTDPHEEQYWRRYAAFAYEQRRYADAIVAYNHLLSRHPNDAQLLNSLAWLHCTAEAPWARDPIRALALAERAYALDQSPSVTDTLAEAAFQNGDVARAIALEEDALGRVHGNDRFYRDQLAKFRRAAEFQGGNG